MQPRNGEGREWGVVDGGGREEGDRGEKGMIGEERREGWRLGGPTYCCLVQRVIKKVLYCTGRRCVLFSRFDFGSDFFFPLLFSSSRIFGLISCRLLNASYFNHSFFLFHLPSKITLDPTLQPCF